MGATSPEPGRLSPFLCGSSAGRLAGLSLLVLLTDCAVPRPVAVPAEVAAAELPDRIVMPPALPRRQVGTVLPDLSPAPGLAEAPAAAPVAVAQPRVEAPEPAPTIALVARAITAPAAAEPPRPIPPVPAPAAIALTAGPVEPEAPAAAPPLVERVAAHAPAPAREGARVQLVAAASEAEAMRHWTRFAQQAPDLAEGRAPIILAVERPDQSPIWRLRVGGFANAEAAQRWCALLRERGLGCWVSG